VETTDELRNATLESPPTLSVVARAVAVFVRPTRAWIGLERRGQWWFPLLISLVVGVVGMALVYQRAVLPTQLEQVERMVEAGQLTPQQYDALAEGMASPGRVALSIAFVPLGVLFMTLLVALMPWIGAGFLLGRPFRFRDAWVVTCWAGLVALPAQVLTFALGWVNESLTSVHIGFGALLPAEEAPSKLLIGLGSFLDQGIGPFAIWHFAVLALGTAALAGSPRKPVLLALGGLWLVLWGIMAVLGGWLSPGA
jgi:hypothetical protein